jgi:hypothetical protein
LLFHNSHILNNFTILTKILDLLILFDLPGVIPLGHAERSEKSPIQSKGVKVPLSNLPQKELNFFRVELEEGKEETPQ